MKGLQPIFLGIFGIFSFSWLSMTVVPNLQIGSLNPESDEEGTDIYPMPQSGMALRGAQVYAANGCFYCHSQQVRPDYGGSDLERGWGKRRSAPRDYIFEPLVMLGKMRTGPDLANVGARLALAEEGAASPAPGTSPAASPAAAANPAASPAPAASPPASSAPAGSPAASPALAGSPAASAAPVTSPAAQPLVAAASPAAGAIPPAANPAPAGSAPPTAIATAEAAPGAPVTPPAAGQPTASPAMVDDVKALTAGGNPLPYSAAWHHRHLYNPRSISADSNMPAYRFLYEKRRIGGMSSPDAINFAGNEDERPEKGWQILPSYDAKCLVVYLMSRNQSHPLKEAKSPVVAAPAASPAKEEAAK